VKDITRLSVTKMEKLLPMVDKLNSKQKEVKSTGLLNRSSRGISVDSTLTKEPALVAAYYIDKFRKMREGLKDE
tara:strand:- start:5732 stop:5953 length:222 start_codon:yes stop_codon:yes gene_type:complete